MIDENRLPDDRNGLMKFARGFVGDAHRNYHDARTTSLGHMDAPNNRAARIK